ncbi:flavin reductase family protein [Nocardioides sp. AE5]|uniref:flavin reductase family protein n=1 Tax=Nocardioides sp. AE5 TaxID=2962573 RepID=UPI002880F17C|nr:flavin reductase family protein [Nocardioides sp. AE5]MDT0201704.1 flavin reductase family protein [Nocardioides sp. AE5]
MIKLDGEPVNGVRLKEVFGCFPSGVTAVSALIDGEPVGMAASSFTAVSLDPPLVSVCMQVTSQTWRKLRSQHRLGVSVLSQAQGHACRSLASPEGDRFDGVAWDVTADGAVLIEGATAWLNCGIHTVVPAGDHAIVLLRVHELLGNVSVEPLVFHRSRFRALVSVQGTA